MRELSWFINILLAAQMAAVIRLVCDGPVEVTGLSAEPKMGTFGGSSKFGADVW